MAAEPDIQPGQVWERRGARGKRLALSQVHVEEVVRDDAGEITDIILAFTFSHGTYEGRRGHITAAGLRKRYRLVAEQQSLV